MKDVMSDFITTPAFKEALKSEFERKIARSLVSFME
jgi:hypothetical protein